jgi:hypothetical protein
LGVIDTQGFRFGNIADIYDLDFLPGGAKYGDLPGLIRLSVPAKLCLAGEGAAAGISALYQKAGASKKLTLSRAAAAEIPEAAVDYILDEWN